MPEHVFLERQCIEEADLSEILKLSATGQLEWGRAEQAAAVGSNVDYSMGPGYSIRHNLLEIRAGYIPDEANAFNYLKLTDFRSNEFYLENFPNEPLLPLAKRVLRVAMFAVATENGRLSGVVQPCAECGNETGHISLYDAPYGIEGAIMAGSGRTECVNCGHTVGLGGIA